MTKAASDGKSAENGTNGPTRTALARVADSTPARGLPPVHLWNPPLSGEMDLRITGDGSWVHERREIAREGLVKLFASILKREGDRFYLVTPVEKWAITVEDAPFVAVDVDVSGHGEAQQITFTTSLGDTAIAGPDNPLRVAGDSTGPTPYVDIRAGLEARIDRKSFYRLIEHGTTAPHAGEDWFGLWSSGVFFPLMRAADL